MACNDPIGGTHHYACDCREAEFAKLRARVALLEKVAEAARDTARAFDPATSMLSVDQALELMRLHQSLRALDEVTPTPTSGEATRPVDTRGEGET